MRLIDADALYVEAMDASYFDNADEDIMKDMINNAPTIDAVRAAGGCYCRECKFWDSEEFAEGGYRVCNCPNKDDAVSGYKKYVYFPLYLASDYCSYGERWEENDSKGTV